MAAAAGMSQQTAAKSRYASGNLHGDLNVVHDRTDLGEAQESAQILKFQLRRRAPVQARHKAVSGGEAEPFDDLAQYEEEDAHIDYRHRMLMNVIAVAIVSALVCVGVWIADTIADMQRAQDCVMQGRQNCAPIELPLKTKE
jgi:hypothetical protein